jgi:enoyl-CoA hydratase
MTDILTGLQGSLGRIRLNRPKAINALTLEMVQSIAGLLENFASDPAVGAVLITGEGERGLCAGGDIRALYDRGRDGSGFGQRFFRSEYRMNAQIKDYCKPVIAIMDGITMGGGVGVSAHGSVRIVTERTKIAMPETGIGFFPDVGGTWLLSRGPGEIGTYIGLTGEAIGGADAIFAGLADFLVQSETLPALIEALATLTSSVNLTEVRTVVRSFAKNVAPVLAAHSDEIDAAFGHKTVEQIVAVLQSSGSPFAQKTLEVLNQKSPTSLKVTLRLLREAASAIALRQCIEQEFSAVHRVLVSDDFYEGVRAAVVDKDRNPTWRPATLAEVTPELLACYFETASETVF